MRAVAERAFLYYTAGVIHDSFAESIRERIMRLAVETNSLIISSSQKPLDFGLNIVTELRGQSAWLCYWQIYQGARGVQKLGIPWICCCEDDTLYTAEHLSWVPPSRDSFWYNRNRWILEQCGGKVYYRYRHNRISMCSCIASTDLMVETLKRLFEKFPEPILERYDPRLKGFGEPGRYEWYLKLPRVGMDFFDTEAPIVTLNHKKGLGGLRKADIKDIMEHNLPEWGPAESVWNEHHG